MFKLLWQKKVIQNQKKIVWRERIKKNHLFSIKLESLWIIIIIIIIFYDYVS
jgi:hypothetical protein